MDLLWCLCNNYSTNNVCERVCVFSVLSAKTKNLAQAICFVDQNAQTLVLIA